MIKIYPSTLLGKVKAPASKDYAQRLLFASAIPAKQTIIKNVPYCRDVLTSVRALQTVGCKVYEQNKGELIVDPFPKTNLPLNVNQDFGSSATTARFMTALCAAYGMNVNARASASLTKRSMLPMFSRMSLRGSTFSNFSLPFTMTGRLGGGYYEFEGEENPQFVSALLFALPLALQDSQIKLTTKSCEPEYIKATIDILKTFGVSIDEASNGFYIKGRQLFQSPEEVTVENDWALSAALVCAGAIGAKEGGLITVTDLPKETRQVYSNLQPIISLLAQDFTSVNINVKEFPELALISAAKAFFSGSGIQITGASSLVHKETNRLAVLADCINSLGGSARATEDGIVIKASKVKDQTLTKPIDCKQDPWIFISFLLCAPMLKEPIIITEDDLADKIFEDFLKIYKSIGGQFEIV